MIDLAKAGDRSVFTSVGIPRHRSPGLMDDEWSTSTLILAAGSSGRGQGMNPMLGVAHKGDSAALFLSVR